MRKIPQEERGPIADMSTAGSSPWRENPCAIMATASETLSTCGDTTNRKKAVVSSRDRYPRYEMLAAGLTFVLVHAYWSRLSGQQTFPNNLDLTGCQDEQKCATSKKKCQMCDHFSSKSDEKVQTKGPPGFKIE